MLNTDLQVRILELKRKYAIYATWSHKNLFKTIIDEMAKPFQDKQIDKVLGLEARGFVLGAPLAYLLNCGFVVARKKGKMYESYTDNDVYQETTVDYSGTTKTIEIEKHDKAIQPGDKVLIVDDWFETGGQGHAAIKLIEKAGATVTGISILLDDMNPEIRNSFSKYDLNALVIKELFEKNAKNTYVLKK